MLLYNRLIKLQSQVLTKISLQSWNTNISMKTVRQKNPWTCSKFEVFDRNANPGYYEICMKGFYIVHLSSFFLFVMFQFLLQMLTGVQDWYQSQRKTLVEVHNEIAWVLFGY